MTTIRFTEAQWEASEVAVSHMADCLTDQYGEAAVRELVVAVQSKSMAGCSQQAMNALRQESLHYSGYDWKASDWWGDPLTTGRMVRTYKAVVRKLDAVITEPAEFRRFTTGEFDDGVGYRRTPLTEDEMQVLDGMSLADRQSWWLRDENFDRYDPRGR